MNTVRGVGAVGLAVGLLVGCAGGAPQGGEAGKAGLARQCAALVGTRPVAYATVEQAAHVAASAESGLPAFCEVTVRVQPVPGSNITSVYRLPDDWNGRLLGLGGGGWASQTSIGRPRPGVSTTGTGLQRGFAVAQTDAGHPAGNAVDPSWVTGNPVAVTDFSHRGIHETAVVGKRVVAAYYGKPAARSYYEGCSTGGRMGLMEAQRYPDDYDGVIAGAPVYTLMVQTSTLVRDRFFRPPAEIRPEMLKVVQAAALAACDADDGLADGVLANPYACTWSPKALQCGAGGAAGSCLTAAQVQALETAYSTIAASDGSVGHYGLTRGSEEGWNPFVPTTADVERHALNGNLGPLVPLIFDRPDFDVAGFDVERDQAAVHRTPFAREYEASSVDLSRFTGRGRKLILWHGLDDPGPSARATQAYYERAVAANGGDNLRYYPAPGVYHCGGGPGADEMDLLTPLQRWVERGEAPAGIVARNSRQGVERPLCEWPKLPHYVAGDPAQAASFQCR